MPKNQRVGAGDGPVKLTGCLSRIGDTRQQPTHRVGHDHLQEEEDHLRFLSPSIDGPRGAVITGGGPVCADGFCCPAERYLIPRRLRLLRLLRRRDLR